MITTIVKCEEETTESVIYITEDLLLLVCESSSIEDGQQGDAEISVNRVLPAKSAQVRNCFGELVC